MSQHAPLVIDIAGTALSADDRRRLAHPLVGGVIFFARNWRDRAQLSAVCADIKALRPDVLLCVDHEGGRVQRFKTDGTLLSIPLKKGYDDAGLDQCEASRGMARVPAVQVYRDFVFCRLNAEGVGLATTRTVESGAYAREISKRGARAFEPQVALQMRQHLRGQEPALAQSGSGTDHQA